MGQADCDFLDLKVPVGMPLLPSVHSAEDILNLLSLHAVPLFDEERVGQVVHGEAEQNDPCCSCHRRRVRHSAATRTAPILKRFRRCLRPFYTTHGRGLLHMTFHSVTFHTNDKRVLLSMSTRQINWHPNF